MISASASSDTATVSSDRALPNINISDATTESEDAACALASCADESSAELCSATVTVNEDTSGKSQQR